MTKSLIQTIKDTGRVALSGAILGAALSVATPKIVNAADNVAVETTVKASEGTNPQVTKLRAKAGLGAVTVTYDWNPLTGIPDEAKMWVDAKNDTIKGYSVGFLAEGEPGNGKKSYGDFGVDITKKFGKTNCEVFVGSTIQPEVAPCIFYQAIARSGNKTLNASIVDDRAKNFGITDLDARVYGSAQIGDFFGGVGINTNGFNDPKKFYGAAGFKTKDLGSYTNFKWEPQKGNLKFKSQNAFGNPSGFYNRANVDLHCDIEGPGMRNMGQPYFGSFVGKGRNTFLVEGDFSKTSKDLKVGVGRNLGVAKAGVGVDYHSENGKRTYNPFFEAAKDFEVKGVGNFSVEGRYNARAKQSQGYVKYSINF